MHTQRIESAEKQAASLAHAVEQRVTRTLRSTDQVLKLVRTEINSRRAWSDPVALAWLLEVATPNLDEVLTVSFIAPNGVITAQSNWETTVGLSGTERDYFIFHVGDTSDRLYIGAPVIDPVSGRRIFTLSRAIRDDKRKLLGILSASVLTDPIAAEFADIRIGKNGAVGLHHLPTYRALARQPDHEKTFAKDFEQGGLAAALNHLPIGRFEGQIADDKVQRFFAYRKLGDLPLAVTVGIARTDITDRLKKDLTGYLALMLVLTLAIAGGTAFVLRAHRREITLNQHLAQKDALFRAFFEAVPAGISTVDHDMHYELVNPALAEINGIKLEAYEGHTVEEVHPSLLKVFAPIHQAVFSTGQAQHNVAFSGHSAGYKDAIGHWQASFFPIFGVDHQVTTMGCFVIDVTAQKNAEAELRHSENLLSTVLEVMPIGIWITDPQGKIIRNNPAGERIWMGDRFCALGNYREYKGWWPETGKLITTKEWALSKAIRHGETSIGEVISIECFDGSRKTILNSAMPLHDHEGKLLGAIAVNEDISALRKAQEEMRISRNFFEQTFNAAPLGMAIADREGRYIKVNRAMTDFLGYTETELLAKTYMDVTYSDDLATNVSLRKEMLAGKAGLIQMEKRYVRKDGRIVWAVMVASTISDQDGNPLYTIGQMLDIDWQKKVEQSLRESESRFRAIFDNSSTGIAAIDTNGFMVYFNEAFRAMLGYSAETLKQKNFSEFTHPDDLIKEKRYLEEIQAGKRESYRLEKRYVRADGGMLWIDISAATIRNSAGNIVNFIAVVRDITESKEATLALVQFRQKLRALSAHQNRILEEDRKHIAREIHDELGQLLTALKMDVSLLRINFGDSPALQKKAEEMRQLVDKTIAVVRQVATNLRPAALDLGLVPAIEWLAEDFSARWEIACTVDIDGGDFVLDDVLSTTVFRVVQESLTNIARHAKATKVAITLSRDHRTLHLVVRDNGHGFDMTAVGRKKGFGFFSMRERVLAAGGNLSVESAPGKGTIISIALPMRIEISQ